MTDLVLAGMAALMGAATLAIVLLYQGWRRNRELITELRAQVAAQQIAALTGRTPAPSPGTDLPEQPEPVRRKRHLSLYIGGGVVAAFTSVRERLRVLWHGHRTLTVTAVATVATVSTAAAIYMTPAGDSAGEENNDSTASVPEQSVPDSSSHEPDDAFLDADTGTVPPGLVGNATDTASLTSHQEGSLVGTALIPSPGDQTAVSEEDRAADEDRADDVLPLPTGQTPSPEQPPAQETPEPAPTDPAPGPGTSPKPTPSPPAGQVPDDDPDGCLCVRTRPLLELCLLGHR